jgi:ribonuclease J
VYATAFTAGMIAAKVLGDPGAEAVPVHQVRAGDRIPLGPFEVEYVNVAHSIPESHALAIRTPLGTVLHTGDWKIDDTPAVGEPTDTKRLKEIGAEGVLALVCDSTNAMREGRSPSESEVERELVDIVRHAKARVAFTTFASNVGRIRSIALAAEQAGRQVVLCGRALRRAVDIAGDLHMLDGLPPFHDEDAFQHLPRERVVAILTGSQGEPRAALARVAADDHPRIELVDGDTLVFSARAIPGNEREINTIVNALVGRGIRVITDRDRLVHVSGHPRRGELVEMYNWAKPKIALPVHGEPVHLAAHADLARELGVETVMIVKDGIMTRLAPEPAAEVERIETDRLYRDGKVVGHLAEIGVPERRKLAFAGHVAVAIAVDSRGDLAADPEIALVGLPLRDLDGERLEDAVTTAVEGTMKSLPRPQRRDPDVLAEAIRRAVRGAVGEGWGKKPVCTVLVSVV